MAKLTKSRARKPLAESTLSMGWHSNEVRAPHYFSLSVRGDDTPDGMGTYYHLDLSYTDALRFVEFVNRINEQQAKSSYGYKGGDGQASDLDNWQIASLIVAAAEAALGYSLTVGMVRDLLRDNTSWEGSRCNGVAAWLHAQFGSGNHIVGNVARLG